MDTENCAASSHKEARQLAQRMLASCEGPQVEDVCGCVGACVEDMNVFASDNKANTWVDIWLRSHRDSGLRLRHWDDMEVVHEQELGG